MNINYNEGGVGRLERSRRIGSLIGLKMLVTLCVFCWHALPQTGLPDLGARRRELFFAISGFLVAYNRHGRFDGSIPGAARYALGKLRGIYPVYLVGLLLALLKMALSGSLALDRGLLIDLSWHALLLQAWFKGIAMSFDGPAWFASALVFCYLCAPAISAAVEGLRRRLGATAGVALAFAAAAGLRLLLELGSLDDPSVYALSVHSNPVVRALEFAMAYCAGVAFLARGGGSRAPRGAAWTAAEIATCSLALLCVVAFDGAWPRFAFVLLAIAVVCVLAHDAGVVSRALSLRPLALASGIELEFYLLHQPVIGIVTAALALLGTGWGYKRAALIALVATVALSAAVRRALRPLRSSRGAGRSAAEGT